MAKMTESEWRAFLVEKPRTGKLGTVRKDGRPHVAPIWFDLDNDGTILFMTGTHTVKGRAIVNGEEAGQGTGADVLGHPHNALAWLANHLVDEGKGLHAGQVVLTGSLVKTVWLNAGDSVKMELDGLGTVEATFA